MKYNLSKIMLKAWKIYRKTKDIHFAERNESMISVMDVLVIFLSGFISAKVCDYVHELEREENEA